MVIDQAQARMTAKIMVEALPYIQRFKNETIVVKYGGNAMIDDGLKRSFVRDMIFLKSVGMHPVVVHGAGPQISSSIAAAGRTSRFIQGLRVTDGETMKIVEDVLVNVVNAELVQLIVENGGNAFMPAGRSMGRRFIHASKLDLAETDPDSGERVDVGYVGNVDEIDVSLMRIDNGNDSIPVVAPVGYDAHGHSYNINADTVAGGVAEACTAEKLIIVTNTEGVLDGDGRLISKLSSADVQELIDSGIISSGMLPKIRCALHALQAGVNAVHIVDGRVEHSVLLEVFTDGGVGTLITA